LRENGASGYGVPRWRELTLIAVFALAMGVLIWLRRTSSMHRRWSRVSKVQADIHNKLMDRFTANDDLLAYIRRRRQAVPRIGALSPSTPDRAPSARPIGRILWSVQVGLVLAAAVWISNCQPQHRGRPSLSRLPWASWGFARRRFRPVGDRVVHPVAQARLWEPSPAQSSPRLNKTRNMGSLAQWTSPA